MTMSKEDYERMLEKAQMIRTAIEQDDWEMLTKAMKIRCIFCMEHSDCRCECCPMYMKKLCHYHSRGKHILPYWVVVRYVPLFDKSKKDEALKASEELVRGIQEIIREECPEESNK